MKQMLTNQYKASLSMLRNCIKQYEEKTWYERRRHSNPAWQIAYHALLFTNAYCSPTAEGIKKWKHECENCEVLGNTPWPPHKKIIPPRTYTQQEILNFVRHVSRNVPLYLEKFSAKKDCWPFWYNMNQLEFHFNNLRHLQHHTGQLLERQCRTKPIEVKWERF